jgi:hypothetical protein
MLELDLTDRIRDGANCQLNCCGLALKDKADAAAKVWASTEGVELGGARGAGVAAIAIGLGDSAGPGA